MSCGDSPHAHDDALAAAPSSASARRTRRPRDPIRATRWILDLGGMAYLAWLESPSNPFACGSGAASALAAYSGVGVIGTRATVGSIDGVDRRQQPERAAGE